MPKYRVHFEASAAVGVELEVEAADEAEAQQIAQRKYDNGALRLSDLVDELMLPDPIATAAYAKTVLQNITYATVELDEAGFEIVDVFVPTDD